MSIEVDVLTGLPNRKLFVRALEHELRRALRYRRALALVLFDLDDRAGDSGGDESLRRVGEALQEVARSTDVLARVGGDEFAALLPETSPEDALWIADVVQRRVAAQYAELGLSVSYGMAELLLGDTAMELLDRAGVDLRKRRPPARRPSLRLIPGGGEGSEAGQTT